ncbi:MAG: PD-(D/E)XK nuclease family protein, partial [Candidatus Shikimatogenerans sp. JK-2022]|nr:PD-(D/E)XK nuclease family protein [Candidatus Shikimatogenerans bostrichidophilus]
KLIFKLLYDYNLIDLKLINIKLLIKNYNNYKNISNWYPNKKNYKINNNIYIYNLYKKYKKKIFKKKRVYYGYALKKAYLKLDNFLIKNKNVKFIFIGKLFIYKLEKLIRDKLILNKKNKFFYIDFKKYKNKNKNKINILITSNNINKFNILYKILIKNLKNKIKTTIIFTNNKYDNLLFKYIDNKYIKHINYNLYYYFNDLLIHNFIIYFFKIKIFNINKIKYEFIYNFFNNIYIKYIIKNKYLNKIIYFLNNNINKKEYINFKLKYVKKTILFNYLKKDINVKNILIFLKKIINILLKKGKLNILEGIYLRRIIIVINNLFKVKINNINTLYKVYKLFLKRIKKISYNNYNYKNYIEIYNIDFIFKVKLINFYENILLILNKYYPYTNNKKSIFNNFIKKKFNLNNKKKYLDKLNNLLKLTKKSYIIYNKNNNFNMLNKKILLKLFINKNFIINFKKVNINYYCKNYSENKSYFKFNKILKKYIKKRGFNFTSLKDYINNPIIFFYKYILKIKIYEYEESKKIGNIIHKILFIIYNRYINIKLNINHINNIKIKVKKIIKIIYKKNYNNYYYYYIIKKFILDFIKNDEELILKGNKIKILLLEKYFKVRIINNYLLTAKIDRIEKFNNNYRIIDYKTYKYIKNKNVFIYNNDKDLYNIFINEFNENILQLLLYVLIFTKYKKYEYIYSTIYYPNKINFIKINNNINIKYDFILKFEKILFNFILKILNKDIKLSYF